MEEQQAPTPSGEVPKPAAKSRALWIVIAVVVVVVVVILAAVFAGLFGPPEDRVLKIGTVLSITGGLAAFGGKNRQGVLLAVGEINQAGGVLGRNIDLFHQDDQTTADVARSAATTLISQNRVDAIIGATGSGQCTTVIEVAKANGVFEISGSCTSPRFSDSAVTDGWWARTAPSDALQGVVAANFARENYTSVAVIGINNAYGTGLSNVFADTFETLGGTVTSGSPRFVTEVQFGASSYTTDLEAVLDVSPAPAALYITAYPPDGILMVQNWEQGQATHPGWASVKLLFSEGVFDQAGFLDKLSGTPNNFDISNYQGTAPSAYGGLTGPNYDDWAASYEDRWGEAPGLFDDNNYDAAYLIALAAQRAGSATGQAIKDNIVAVANPPGTVVGPGDWAAAVAALAAGNDIDYEGASGSVNIDSLGDPFSGYIVWGVDANDDWRVDKIYDEATVAGLLPAPAQLASQLETRDLWNPLAPTREW